jgi:site-specific DNA recombinase
MLLRCSCPKQKEATIEDQDRQCRKVAKEKNWVVQAGHTYADQAKSGTSLFKRKELAKLMADAKKKPRPFDIVMLFETSRLARNLEDMLRLTRKLSELGIRVYFVGQGLDSSDPNFRTTLTVWGMVDELFIASLRRNVWKGQDGQVLKGFSSGSRCFGYPKHRVESWFESQLKETNHDGIEGSQRQVELPVRTRRSGVQRNDRLGRHKTKRERSERD